jgi:branched-chain amino acid transport system substrate-binding protein
MDTTRHDSAESNQMEETKKGNGWLVGTIVIVILVIACLAVFNKPTETGPIKIGVIGPFTGDASSYGIPFKNSVEMATNEINSNGGIAGRQLQILFEDGKCGGNAASAAQKLVSIDQVKIIIGGFCSGESLSAEPVTTAHKVILFSPGSSNPKLSGISQYFDRNYPSDNLPGAKIAQLMIDKNYRNVAVISETSDAAVGLRGIFVDSYAKLGGTLVADETFTTGTRDFRSNLAKIKKVKPDAVYVIAQTPASDELIIRQMSEIGLKTQLFGGFELFGGVDILKNIPDLLEGAIYMQPSLDETATTTATFIAKYTDQYKSFGGLPSIYAATAYDAVYLMKDMIEKYGLNADKISKGLRQVKDWHGVEGSLTINKDGDPEFEYSVMQIHAGKAVQVK